MKEELEQKLFTKYPEIFSNRFLSEHESPMTNGICVGDGWYNIIDKLCLKIMQVINKDDSLKESFKINEIKTKYGMLYFYTNQANEKIDKYIMEAELESQTICSNCGDIILFNKSDVILCSKCRNKLEF
jgi:ribosomal protein S27AE